MVVVVTAIVAASLGTAALGPDDASAGQASPVDMSYPNACTLLTQAQATELIGNGDTAAAGINDTTPPVTWDCTWFTTNPGQGGTLSM